MNRHTPIEKTGIRKTFVPSMLAVAAIISASGAVAAPATLSDATPVGKLGGELIRHVNTDSPAQIRTWASTVLSSTVAAEDKAAFLADLTSAARDSGGVDVVDVQTDPRQPGLLEVAVKGRRAGQRALVVLAADPAHSDRLAQAGVYPMDDPAIYAAWPKAAVSHDAIKHLVDTTLDQMVRTTDFSGCVTVMDGDETVVDACRGLAERRFGTPIDRQTRFHIGSMDKMFTAVAIAQLVEAGKLSWDATLDSLVPEYPDRATAKKINVWQLLHHTAGLGDFFVTEFFEHQEKFVNPADYLDLIARQPTVGEPGKDSIYSNAGYIMLGRIVENVSHEAYFDYIQRHVFAPAGMSASGFDRLDEITPKLAVGYFHDGLFSAEWKADWLKTGYKGSPAGGGYSNNGDILRFAKALREGKLVKPSTLTKMFDDEVPAGPGGYATGFGDRLSHGRHIRGHRGSIQGTEANLAMVWETQGAIAVTSNEGPAESWMLAERLADLLAAAGAKP